MRKHLFRNSAVAISVGLIIAFALALPLIRNIFFNQTEKSCESIIALLESNYDEVLKNPDGFAEKYTKLLSKNGQQLRITILDTNGNVLGDSGTDKSITENHKSRPEIQKALKGEWGFDARKSSTLNIQYRYAAHKYRNLIFRVAVPFTELSRTNNLLLICMLIGIVAGFIVAIITSLISTRRIITPINNIITATKKITSGDLTAHVPLAPYELGELSDEFNTMTRQLQVTHNDLRENRDRLNSIIEGMDDGVIAVDKSCSILLLTDRAKELLGDVSQNAETLSECGPNYPYIKDLLKKSVVENKQIRETIKIQQPQELILQVFATPIADENDCGSLAVIADVTRMKKLEQMRSEFVANVTHELKTPLTSIKGYIELLKGENRDKETQEKFFEIIEIEAERLQNLINDLLELSVIENSHGDCETYQTSVKESIESVLEKIRPIAEKAGITVETDISDSLTVNANPNRLQQLFLNLIDNAVKYNKENGKVEITARRERKMAVIKISDTGIGIPQESLSRIFERFYRVDKGRSREMGGTGLGLSIVKHIVSLYNGDISVESKMNVGTTFIIRLP